MIMEPHFKYLLCALILASIVTDSFGIKCWDCRSQYEPRCADPFDNSTVAITDCNMLRGTDLDGSKPNVCRKIKQKVNGEWRIIRDCAYQSEVGVQTDEKVCFTKTGSDNILTEYCTCNSRDGCNSAFVSLPTTGLLTVLPVLCAMFAKA